MDKETKRKVKITLIGIIGIIILLIGVSFAAFSSDLAGVQIQSMQTGCLKVDMTDNGSVNMTNEAPTSDEDGLTKTPYTYTLTNTCTTDAFYTTTINVMNSSNLDNISKIKVSLEGDSYLAPTIESNLEEMASVDTSETNISKTYKLDEGYLKVGETKTFNLRTWIDYDVTSITGGLENKVIVLSEAREGQTIDYDTNTSGYDVLKLSTMLTNVSYKDVATENGIIKVEENDNVKYYFRGNPNNNLTFAGLNFKVLSTNNDGSVNIVLNDTIGTSTYSNIETTLNNWYTQNITEEEQYVKTDATYCVETENSDGDFLAKIRVENANPSITCNGDTLTKVGLLTADDLMYAGAVTGKANTSFYLHDNNSYFLSTFKDTNTLYTYRYTNSIAETESNTTWYVKPVITLKSNVMIEGEGTSSSPFYVSGTYGEEKPDTTDKTAPTITYARTDERWSKENKSIKIVGTDNAGGTGIGGYLVKSSNTKPASTDSGWEATSSRSYTTINTYDNGTYYVFVKDNSGNVSEGKEVVIDKVDKTAPSCTIRINPNGTKAAYKTLSIMTEETNIDLNGYSWDHTESKADVIKVTEAGVYTAHITDLAGNQGSCSGTVINIENAVDKIINKVGTDGIATESHSATSQLEANTDYRYTGADPNNYVTFNDELWRIIGVFPTDDGTGTIENRIKIIRNESIGDIAWNSTINDWSTASLQQLLNSGDYYNRTGNYASNGLTEEAKSMINDAKWYLGGSSSYNDVTTGMFYERERGTDVYSDNPTSFIGEVGLMYPSDYGYATSGGSTTNREECLAKELYNWDSSSYSDCKNNDWLFNGSTQWTMAPFSGDSYRVFAVNAAGRVGYDSGAYGTYAVRPVLALESTVEITGGTGTENNPYTLEI